MSFHCAAPYTLPVLNEQAFRDLAASRGVDIRRHADACRFDLTLRREGVGYAPANAMRAWYREHAMAHGRILTVEDFKKDERKI